MGPLLFPGSLEQPPLLLQGLPLRTVQLLFWVSKAEGREKSLQETHVLKGFPK